MVGGVLDNGVGDTDAPNDLGDEVDVAGRLGERVGRGLAFLREDFEHRSDAPVVDESTRRLALSSTT